MKTTVDASKLDQLTNHIASKLDQPTNHIEVVMKKVSVLKFACWKHACSYSYSL